MDSISSSSRRRWRKRGERSSRTAAAASQKMGRHEEEEEEEEVERVVKEFREALIEKNLLPARHDDCYKMRRFLKARGYDIDKAINMWSGMLQWRTDFGTDSILQNWVSAGKLAHDVVIDISKIDSNNYPEILNKMFIVNAGSGFRLLWSALKGFIDPRTSAKIQVLGDTYQNTLLECIDPSQLPDFLGGSCTCQSEGGCLRSNKGPWTDPDIMKDLKYNEFTIQPESDVGNVLSNHDATRNENVAPSSLTTQTDVHHGSEGASSDNLFLSRSGTIFIQVARAVAFFLVKLFAILHIFPGLGNLDPHNVESYSSNANAAQQLAPHGIREDSVTPCLERLQRLEEIIYELNKKPTIIPPEKDDMITESLNRIKSIEYDLQKTKSALSATSLKQEELAESLEHLKQTSVQRRSCWLKDCKSLQPEG